jgi:hypothetical protein
MTKVKNRKQGTEWEIEDPAMLKRMRADPEHYEILDDRQPVTQTQGVGQEIILSKDKGEKQLGKPNR